MDPKLEPIIQKTIKTLKKSVKKTPLTPKLLSKPPFRYLHDLISEIIRNTGFAKDLYDDEEKQSTNKDKEGKIKYLTKMINVVGIITNQSLKVNPLKVVAGMEPDQTNIFLQFLGEAALTKVEESKDVVKRVLAGETMKKPQKAGATQRKSSDPKLHSSNPKLSSENKDKSIKGSQGHIAKTDPNKKPTGTSSSSKHTGSTNNLSQKKSSSNAQASSKTIQKSSEANSNHSSTQNLNQGNPKKSSNDGQTSSNNNANGNGSNGNQSNSNSHSGHQRNMNDTNATSANTKETSEKDINSSQPTNDDPKKSVKSNSNNKPSNDANTSPTNNSNTANGNGNSSSNANASTNEVKVSSGDANANGRPKSKSNNDPNGGINENIPEANPDDQIDIAIEQEAVVSHIIANSRYRERPASARPPPPKQRHSNIIQDSPVKVATPIVIQETSQQQDEEEENEYLIINQDNQDFNKPMNRENNKENDQFGGLVQHILDTKKDLEGESNEKDSSLKLSANENESKDMIHAKKDINSLRESIQFLCRNTNPLGKTMDYIQEDFDSMTKELESWKSESIKYNDMLKNELEITEETLRPLQEQLREVEQNIAEELERINSQNATIIRNKEKIDKLLQSIVHPIR